MGKLYDDAIARWRCSSKQREAQKIYLEFWNQAKEHGCLEQGDEDAMFLNKALDIAEGIAVYELSLMKEASTEYDEAMRAIEIMEELNGDQEEGNSNFIAGMVEAS